MFTSAASSRAAAPKPGGPALPGTIPVRWDAALDLPLKIPVAEDAQAKIWPSYSTSEYLKERYGLPSNLLPNVAVIETTAANAAEQRVRQNSFFMRKSALKLYTG
jgi:hypothetical protein